MWNHQNSREPYAVQVRYNPDTGENVAGLLCSESLRRQMLRPQKGCTAAAGNSKMCLMHIFSNSAC